MTALLLHAAATGTDVILFLVFQSCRDPVGAHGLTGLLSDIIAEIRRQRFGDGAGLPMACL